MIPLPRKLAAIALAFAATGLLAHHHGAVAGRAEVQARWDAEKLATGEAEKRAVFDRIRNNERIAQQQEIDNEKITAAHQSELAAVRAFADAHAGQLGRLQFAANCPGGSAAGAAKAKSAGASDGATAGTIALPEPLARDLWALMAEADTVTVNCRALQQFVIDNGMAP